MTIGIIGAGAIGAAFARMLARAGIQATKPPLQAGNLNRYDNRLDAKLI